MRKLLILHLIGFVIELSGCVIGYFAGVFWGAMVFIVGACMMLIGDIGIVVQEHKEKREKRKKKRT